MNLDEYYRKELSAGEAVFGFVGWLTSRKEVSGPFSAKHDAISAAALIKKFCDANDLEFPDEGWKTRLKYPIE